MESYRQLALRYLKVKKFRMITIIFGVIISVSLITGIFTLFNIFRDKAIDISEEQDKTHIELFGIKANEAIGLMSNIKMESTAFSTYIGRAEGLESESSDGIPILIRDINSIELKGFEASLWNGNAVTGINQITMPEEILEANNYKIGDIITLNYINSKEKQETIEGKLVGTNNYGNIVYFTDKTFLVDRVDKNEKIDIYLRYKNIDDLNEDLTINFPERFNYKIENGSVIYTEDWYSEDAVSIQLDTFSLALQGVDIGDGTFKMFKYLMVFLIFLVILCSVGLIYNGFMININDRVKEFALLRAVGTSKKQIKNILIIEGMIIGLIGIILGVLGGIFGIYVLVQVINKINIDKNYIFNFTVSYKAIIGSILVSILTIIISIIIPLRKVDKIAPVEGMKSFSITKEKVRKVKRVSLFNKFFGGKGYLANKNIKRNRGRARSIVFGFSLSIFIFVSFSAFTGSFDKLISIEEGLRENKFSVDGEADVEKIREIDEVKYIYNEKHLSIPKNGDEKFIEEYQNTKFNEVSGNLYPLFKTVDYEIAKGEITKDNNLTKEEYENGIIIANKAILIGKDGKEEIIITNLEVGDKIDLKIPYVEIAEDESYVKNKEYILKSIEVVGIIDTPMVIDKYSNIYEIYTSESLLNNIAKEVHGEVLEHDNYWVISQDGKMEDVFNKVNKDKDYYNITWLDDFTSGKVMMEKLVLVANIGVYGFLTLITLITLANILASVSANINSRRKEIALIRSVGASKDFIKKSIIIENLNYFFYSILYGGTLGVIASLIINSIMDRQYKLLYEFPIKPILISATMLIIVVSLINQYSIKKLCDNNIVDEIREE